MNAATANDIKEGKAGKAETAPALCSPSSPSVTNAAGPSTWTSVGALPPRAPASWSSTLGHRGAVALKMRKRVGTARNGNFVVEVVHPGGQAPQTARAPRLHRRLRGRAAPPAKIGRGRKHKRRHKRRRQVGWPVNLGSARDP